MDKQRRIMFLVKVFDHPKHASCFIHGHIRMNRLSVFRKMENNNPREDAREGVFPFQSDGEPKVRIIPQRDRDNLIEMYGPGNMQVSRINDLNILCMYAGLFHADDRKYLTRDQRIRQLSVPEEYNKFGDYAVLVHDPEAFISRMGSKTKARFSSWRRAVTYYDVGTFDIKDLSEEVDIAFHKPNVYAAEKEYRFAIDTFTQGPDPVTLDVGMIDDIAIRVDRAELNSVIFREHWPNVSDSSSSSAAQSSSLN